MNCIPEVPSEVRQHILRQAQDRLLDRAACGEWPAPQAEAEWLAWMLDELEIQADMLRDGHGDEAENASRTAFAGVLSEAILTLIRAGVVPSPLPWEKRVLGYVVYHGYSPHYTPEELAQESGVELYPFDHPGQQHYASCPDGGQHLLISAAGPWAIFRENHWPVLEEPNVPGRAR